MTDTRRNSAWTVRALFLVALVVLFVPSRLMALAQGAVPARVAGASISTLLVWWFLYRLCVRARPQAWFVAAAIPALWMGVFAAPAYAWGVLILLYLLRRLTRGYFQMPPDSDRMRVTPPPLPPLAEAPITPGRLATT